MRNADTSLPISRLAAAIAIALAPIAASAASPAGQHVATSSEIGIRPFIIAAPTALPSRDKAAAAPTASASPSSVDFGSVVVGISSSPQTITISYGAGFNFIGFDTYGGSFCYGSGIYGGAFSPYSSTCSTGSASSAGSCTFTVQYTPFAYQSDSTTVYVCDSSFSAATSFTLTGQGVPQPPVSAGPDPYDFGDVQVGQPSAPARFGFYNPGPFSVYINPPGVLSGDFAVTDTDCGTILGPGSSCTATVVFQPTVEGGQSTFLVLPAGFGPAVSGDTTPKASISLICDCSFLAAISLTGNGVFQSQMQVSPDAVTFPPYTLGNPAETQNVTVTNTGNSLMTMSSISVTSPFTETNNCPGTLQQGDSCTVTVGFSATVAGDVTGTLSIASDGGSASVPLSASAQLVPVPVLNVSPLSIGFGDRMIGSGTTAQHITVKNVGGAPATLNPLTISLDFTIENTSCGTGLAPGASCTVDVSFRPIGFGSRGGTLTVIGNDSASPHVVNLSGAGCRPFIFGRGSSCGP